MYEIHSREPRRIPSEIRRFQRILDSRHAIVRWARIQAGDRPQYIATGLSATEIGIRQRAPKQPADNFPDLVMAICKLRRGGTIPLTDPEVEIDVRMVRFAVDRYIADVTLNNREAQRGLPRLEPRQAQKSNCHFQVVPRALRVYYRTTGLPGTLRNLETIADSKLAGAAAISHAATDRGFCRYAFIDNSASRGSPATSQLATARGERSASDSVIESSIQAEK